MSRQRVALLFVVYFIVSVAIPVVIVALAMPSEVSISRMTPPGFIGAAIRLGITIYFVSGVLPFAVWGARGFKAANARGDSDHCLVCTLSPRKYFVRAVQPERYL